MGQGNTGRGSKTYDADNRLIVGNSDNGGLADVNNDWHDNRNDNIAFRVLAVLYPSDFSHPPTIFPISRSSPDLAI